MCPRSYLSGHVQDAFNTFTRALMLFSFTAARHSHKLTVFSHVPMKVFSHNLLQTGNNSVAVIGVL